MIYPEKVFGYHRPLAEVEEFAIFCLMVAGKNASTTARLLDSFLRKLHERFQIKTWQPFLAVHTAIYYSRRSRKKLPDLLHDHGFGCYRAKAKGLTKLVRSNIDLQQCTVEDLEKIPQIGPKTARYFILHTRPNARVACLDVHILKYMRSLGYDVPKTTPSGRKYHKIEEEFLKLVDGSGKSVADFDIDIWNSYAR